MACLDGRNRNGGCFHRRKRRPFRGISIPGSDPGHDCSGPLDRSIHRAQLPKGNMGLSQEHPRGGLQGPSGRPGGTHPGTKGQALHAGIQDPNRRFQKGARSYLDQAGMARHAGRHLRLQGQQRQFQRLRCQGKFLRHRLSPNEHSIGTPLQYRHGVVSVCLAGSPWRNAPGLSAAGPQGPRDEETGRKECHTGFVCVARIELEFEIKTVISNAIVLSDTIGKVVLLLNKNRIRNDTIWNRKSS